MEQIHLDHAFDRYSVSPKDNPEKFIIIQNNRPSDQEQMQAKIKTSHRILKEGEVKDNKNFDILIKAIENVLEPPAPVKKNTSSWNTSTPTNRKQKPKGGATLGDWMK